MFLLFFGTMLTLFGLMQWRLYRLFRAWTHRAAPPGRAAAWLRGGKAVLIAANLLFVLRFVYSETGGYDSPLVQGLVIYPGAIFFAATVLAFLIVSVSDLVSIVWSGFRAGARWIRPAAPVPRPAAARPEQFDADRRRFLRVAGVATAGSIGAVPMIGAASTARDYAINRITLPVPGLPSGLNGLTVAQISDIHSGMFMTESNMRDIFERVNALRPDLAPKVEAALRDRGIDVLSNEHRVLTINGESMAIAGVDDEGKGERNFADLPRALAGLDPQMFSILLTHRPEVYRQSKAAGVDLTLAGHTHGGQVGIQMYGINLNPVYLMYEYPRGLYLEQGRYLYVNVGVGMVGVPIRLVRPEISLFTLTSGPAALPS
ncbi:MAG: putative phosphohydrolase, superfamily [Bacteroidetes bacterium]|nr:putative phosphohydrolase, superfamily [Bacteroidota bacterium]